MNEEQAFLEAISSQPDDDGPRLIFADWLEERGDSRGEFIRVQCTLSRLEENDPQRRRLQQAESRLLRQHGRAWSAALTPTVKTYEYRRGFVEVVEMTAGGFLRHAARLFQNAPIREVQLSRLDDRMARLAACPYLARLAALDLRANGIDDALARLLGASPHLRQLRTLNVSSNQLTSAGALALLESLPGVTGVQLWANHLGQAGAEALASSPVVAHLTALGLGYNQLGDEGVAALCASPHRAGIVKLDLAGNEIGDAGVQALAASRSFSGLKILALSDNDIGNVEARLLAASPVLAGVEVLHLRDNQIGDAGAQALAESPHLTSIKALDLSGNRIADAGVRALAESLNLHELRELNLSGNRIGAAGARAFLTSHLDQLKSLDLTENPISGEAVEELQRDARLGERVQLDEFYDGEDWRYLARSDQILSPWTQRRWRAAPI